MVKKLLIGGGILAVLILGAVFFVGSNLDSLIKVAVEKYGTAATKAETTLQSVKLCLSEGAGGLYGFKLGNPEGFSSESAIKIGEASIKVDPKSIMGTGPIIIHEIVIAAPEITYEVTADGKTNLQTIQKNVSAFSGQIDTGDKKSGGEAAKKEEPQRKIVIEKFIVKDGKIKLNHALLKGKDVAAVKLPDMNITSIGRDGGASPAVVAKTILSQLTTNAIDAGGEAMVKQLRDQGIESIKSAVEQSEVGKEVGKAIEGIFGK